MPENVNYKIDLYYGDIGFTSDYANVLQFEDAAARDSYFNKITEKDTVNNTDFNNIQLSGNKVKIAFTDNVELSRLEKYNYIRILTRLYGTSSYSDKYEYGFIVDYSIISSSSNVTVVEFTFEVDLWQNYQLDFELKECKVERSHMDRWNKNGSKIKYTRPTYDALDSYMKIVKNVPIKNRAKFYEYETTVHEITEDIAMVYISYTLPTSTEGNEVIALYAFPVRLTYDTASESNYSGAILMKRNNGTTVRFPNINSVIQGNIYYELGLDGNRIVNVQIVYNSAISIKGVVDGTNGYRNILVDGENNEFSIQEYINNGTGMWRLFGILPVDTHLKTSKIFYVNKTLPEKPQDGADYNTKYEIMLYKSPVIKRYISNYDGSAIIELTDAILEENIMYITTRLSHVGVNNIISNSKNVNDSSIINASCVIPGLGGDFVSNAWKNYIMEYRNTDRELMWANILTGGLSDAGSTAISAGIGYRSNAERSFMYNTLGDGTTQNKAMAGMFDKYAKQAAGMSLVGGIAQFGANAVGSYLGQEIKEKSIKNTPGSLPLTGDAFAYLYSDIDTNLNYIETRCDDETYNQYANIFKKFGYYIGAVIQPDIKSRKYFNYIKTNGAILTGSLNQSILAKLCRIFDNGVTIWHMDYATGHLYEYNKENIERTLIGE